MKFQVILYADESAFQYEKVLINSRGAKTSAFNRSLEWALNLIQSNGDSGNPKIALLGTEGALKSCGGNFEEAQAETHAMPENSVSCMLKKMADIAESSGAGFVVFAPAAAAFLDLPLSKKLIQDHVEYRAEYTFADGYPAGFAPEIIDSGALKIIAELSKTVSAEAGKKPVSQGAVFEVIKGDVNSFEIETEIADYDYRLLRLNFICTDKLCLKASENLCALLYKDRPELLNADLQKCGGENVLAVSDIAKTSAAVLKTLPAYYQIQAVKSSPDKNAAFMDREKFDSLAEKIKAFSDKAVVSLSLFGEACLHPDLLKLLEKLVSLSLTPLIEINGEHLPAALEKLSGVKTDSVLKNVIVIACLDAFSEETFGLFHKGLSLKEAVSSVQGLSEIFPETYVQFTRVKKNEHELEGFWRFWSDKGSPSKGKVIIQKYDDFCGALPDEKTADLSPVVRECCWHLRRDMEIMMDGSVPVCRETLLKKEPEIIGNAFEESLEEVWSRKNGLLDSHILKNYPGLCGKCDEYYTFNF